MVDILDWVSCEAQLKFSGSGEWIYFTGYHWNVLASDTISETSNQSRSLNIDRSRDTPLNAGAPSLSSSKQGNSVFLVKLQLILKLSLKNGAKEASLPKKRPFFHFFAIFRVWKNGVYMEYTSLKPNKIEPKFCQFSQLNLNAQDQQQKAPISCWLDCKRYFSVAVEGKADGWRKLPVCSKGTRGGYIDLEHLSYFRPSAVT